MARPLSVSDQKILSEAHQLITEYGPSGLTFERLSTRVGLVPAALVRRFKNKQQLFLQVDQYALECTNAKVEEEMHKTASPIDAIILLFITEKAFASSVENFVNGEEFLLMAIRNKKLYKNYQVSFKHRHKQIAALLQKAQSNGELEGCDNVEEFARHLEMIVHGAGHVWAMTQEEKIESYIRHHIEIALKPYCKKKKK